MKISNAQLKRRIGEFRNQRRRNETNSVSSIELYSHLHQIDYAVHIYDQIVKQRIKYLFHPKIYKMTKKYEMKEK
jgi:hypothetical protein